MEIYNGFRHCLMCGEQLTSEHQYFCGDTCAAEHFAIYRKLPKEPGMTQGQSDAFAAARDAERDDRVCLWCGEEFSSEWAGNRFCVECAKCSRTGMRPLWRRLGPAICFNKGCKRPYINNWRLGGNCPDCQDKPKRRHSCEEPALEDIEATERVTVTDDGLLALAEAGQEDCDQ